VPVYEDLALNDVVLTGNGPSRFLSLRAQADGQDMLSFDGDGVIVSTPTGSTAHSLSAGGPVMEPHAESILVTPVCARLPYIKSMVLPAGRAVTLSVSTDKQAVLLVDGQAEHPLSPGDEALIRRADQTVTLLRIKPYNFYETLRRKLQI